MRLLITGGAGFIGSCFVRHQRRVHPNEYLVVLDALTYAGNRASLDGIEGVHFEHGNICYSSFVEKVIKHHNITAIVHMAAESHVDRSITGASVFSKTNVLGTQTLLEISQEAKISKFLMVGTDESYGDLADGPTATEISSLHPSSPYSASKASADLFSLAYYRTYHFPVIISRSTNNYGPRQYPEKLIPLAILHALAGESIPVYGDGKNIRDWLHVQDHCDALDLVLRKGRDGEIYNIGSGVGWENIEVVRRIIDVVGKGDVKFVADRKGHDRRYAVNTDKIRKELDWSPQVRFEYGIVETVKWYKENEWWWRSLLGQKEV